MQDNFMPQFGGDNPGDSNGSDNEPVKPVPTEAHIFNGSESQHSSSSIQTDNPTPYSHDSAFSDNFANTSFGSGNFNADNFGANADTQPNTDTGFGPAPSTPGTPNNIASQPFKAPKPPKAPKVPGSINSNLVILSVVLGVIALIATVVSIWLLVNRSSTKKTETVTTTNQTVKEDTVSAKTFGFYQSKITNPTAEVIYRLGVHRSNNDGNGVFGAYISTDNSQVDLYIYWNYIAGYYGVPTENTNRELATLTFDQPVVDIIFGETGQSVSGDVLLFLLADGTVEYMPVAKALLSHDFRSFGQLAGVEKVVKFYHVDAVSDTGDWSGYVTTLAQREDGSIVDLQSFMLATLTE